MRIFSLIFFGGLIIMGLTSCHFFAPTEKYGAELSGVKNTEIKDILAAPQSFEGKPVIIEGKITSECSTGCWFYLSVGAGNLSIYVDTKNSGFAIPQKVGKYILVEGTVAIKKTGPMIQAKGVVIK